MRGRAIGAFLGALLFAGLLGLAGWSVFQAGYRQGSVENASEVVVPAYGFFPGFGIFFGFLFLFLLFGFISRLFFWRRWRGGPFRAHWKDWSGVEGSPMERKLADWHEKAHGEPSARRYRSDESPPGASRSPE